MVVHALRTPDVALDIASQIIAAVLNIARVQPSACTVVLLTTMVHMLPIVMIQVVDCIAILELGRAAAAGLMFA